jgi:hypothetical protein
MFCGVVILFTLFEDVEGCGWLSWMELIAEGYG